VSRQAGPSTHLTLQPSSQPITVFGLCQLFDPDFESPLGLEPTTTSVKDKQAEPSIQINIGRLTRSTTTRERAVWTLTGFYDLHRNAGTHAPYIAGNLLNLLKLDHRARPGPQPQTAETSVDTTSTERR
jgi:hypothetical protein